MSKFFLFAVISISILSCNKAKVDLLPPPANTPPVVTPGDPNLSAYFKFSSSIADESGKANSASEGIVVYTTDRHGEAGKALQCDGVSTKLIFSNIDQKKTACSISVWVALDDIASPLKYFLNCTKDGISMSQYSGAVYAAISTPGTESTAAFAGDINWHHYAATFDGANLLIYKDGVLASTKAHPGFMMDGKVDFTIGKFVDFWKGRIDDLRFYNKVLDANEILVLSKE